MAKNGEAKRQLALRERMDRWAVGSLAGSLIVGALLLFGSDAAEDRGKESNQKAIKIATSHPGGTAAGAATQKFIDQNEKTIRWGELEHYTNVGAVGVVVGGITTVAAFEIGLGIGQRIAQEERPAAQARTES